MPSKRVEVPYSIKNLAGWGIRKLLFSVPEHLFRTCEESSTLVNICNISFNSHHCLRGRCDYYHFIDEMIEA